MNVDAMKTEVLGILSRGVKDEHQFFAAIRNKDIVFGRPETGTTLPSGSNPDCSYNFMEDMADLQDMSPAMAGRDFERMRSKMVTSIRAFSSIASLNIHLVHGEMGAEKAFSSVRL